MITQQNKVSMVPGQSVPVRVCVSQYDTARVLSFKLVANDSPYTPPAGATATISGTKPDNTCFRYPATISGSTVSVQLQDQMTVLAGNVPCEITITESSGRVSTANFLLGVEPTPFDESAISTTDVPILEAFTLGGQDGQIFVSDGQGSGSWQDPPNDGVWGQITGDINDQTDLKNALDGKVPNSKLGAANGVAELDSSGKVPSTQLPSYVDDVLEYASESAFPATGETGKIYVAKDTNKTYRWGGSSYVEISESLALGETSSTAYRGDRGKAAYDHSQLTSGNPHNVTKTDVGLGNVDNTSDADKPISTATAAALAAINGNIAITETSPATAAHAVGDFILYNGLLYLVTAAIGIGDTLTVGTNITLDTVGNELTFLRNAVTSGEIYSDWSVIKNMVAAGYGPQFYPVGTQFLVSHSAYTSILFDVVQHIAPDSDALHKAMLPAGKQYGMVLLMNKVIYSTQFDKEEAFYFAENGLVAGTYNVVITRQPWYAGDVGKTFQFTLASDVPAGGILCWGSYNESREGKNVTVYANRSTTTASQTAVMTEGSGGTALTDINVFDRTVFGSNDWEESAMRQWLNANVASGWWTPQTGFDRICDYSNRAGFLYGFPQAFKDAIMVTTHANRSNEIFDSHGVKTAYNTQEKIFLLSQEEVGFSSESGITCGKVLDYFVGAANADRIKYDISNGTTARHWFLRTPSPSSAHHERIVYSDGSQDSYGAHNGSGAVAACVIG